MVTECFAGIKGSTELMEDLDHMPIGYSTNLAARMQQAARSGSVVVSEATRRLVEGYFPLKRNPALGENRDRPREAEEQPSGNIKRV
jgi:class 3 adenylate cyclase